MNYTNTLLLFLFFLSISCISCGNQGDYCNEELECSRISDIKTIDEDDKINHAIYYELYCYQNKMYTVSYCPMCIVFTMPMAVDCDENELCDIADNCMETFFEEAELQFIYVRK